MRFGCIVLTGSTGNTQRKALMLYLGKDRSYSNHKSIHNVAAQHLCCTVNVFEMLIIS